MKKLFIIFSILLTLSVNAQKNILIFSDTLQECKVYVVKTNAEIIQDTSKVDVVNSIKIEDNTSLWIFFFITIGIGLLGVWRLHHHFYRKD